MKTDVSEDEMGSDLMIIWSSDFSNFTMLKIFGNIGAWGGGTAWSRLWIFHLTKLLVLPGVFLPSPLGCYPFLHAPWMMISGKTVEKYNKTFIVQATSGSGWWRSPCTLQLLHLRLLLGSFLLLLSYHRFFLFVLLLWSGDGVFLYFLNTPLTTHDNHFVNIKESASHPISATPFLAECPRCIFFIKYLRS